MDSNTYEWKANQDPGNRPIHGLAWTAGLLITVGVLVAVIAALNPEEVTLRAAYFAEVVSTPRWGLILAGAGAASFGVQIYIGLLFFWGWRKERRMSPAYGDALAAQIARSKVGTA